MKGRDSRPGADGRRDRRRGGGRGPAAGAIVLAFAAALLLGAASPAVAARSPDARPGKARLFRVLAPRDESIAHGHAVTVRVRLGPGVNLRSVRLNGIGVKRYFRRAGSSRVLRARLDRRRLKRALRRGRNFIRFLVRRGRVRDTATVAFTRVRPSRHLVRRVRARLQRRRGLHVSLALSKLHVKIRARLNGHDVSRLFGSGLSSRRGASFGADDGLRHGRNVLRLRVTHFDGEIRKLRRVFFVPRGVTIAGAGPSRRIEAGAATRLSGKSSLPALRPNGKPAPGGIGYRWTVVGRPRGSHAGLLGRNGPQPRFSPDQPGRYRVRLTTTMSSAAAGDHSTTSFDTTEVIADAQPYAAVDTMAVVGGKSGIAVEATRECAGPEAAAKPPCFYPNEGAEDELQVVVLERDTLQPVSNSSYSTDDLSAFAREMQEKFIIRLGDSTSPAEYEIEKLVLISLRSGDVADAKDLADGLSIFNVSQKPEAEAKAQPFEGLEDAAPFSLIGVPGTLEGKVAVNFGGEQIQAPDGSLSAGGALVGGLKKVSDEPGASEPSAQRGFAWPDAIPYDTRAMAHTAPGGDAFRLGHEQVQVLPEGSSADLDGLALFTFNPVNPAGTLQRTEFVTNAGGAETNTGLDWSQLASKLESAVKAELGVAIVSNGDIGRFPSEPDAAGFTEVQSALDQLGVNPDVLARAVAEDGTYSMISAGRRPGSPQVPGELRAGYSASSAIAAGVQQPQDLRVGEGRLTGVLQRTTYGALFPTGGDPSGSPPEAELLQLVFQKQVPWLLTPAPEASAAGCQQVAFAYIVEKVGLVPANESPQLWSGSSAAPCRGESHTGTEGTRRADNLDGDSCATSEASASGADPAAVRSVSMHLRNQDYLSTDFEVAPSQIEAVQLPSGAPFTAADLTCAKNQMVDEVVAQSQVKKYIAQLRAAQVESQGSTAIELESIAEEVKTAQLASIESKLQEPHEGTAAFWASYAFQAIGAAAKITAFVDDPLFADEATAVGQAASIGQGILPLIQGRPGNPVELTDQYLLLSAQLTEEGIAIEKQIAAVLNAQQNGSRLTEAVLLSDPSKMADVNANVKDSVWSVPSEAVEGIQDAYFYRVRQMAYQAFWPQVYSGVRIDYKNICQEVEGRNACWNGSEWRGANGVSLSDAGAGYCSVGGSEKSEPFNGGVPGTPAGLGQGNEYWPLSIPGTEGLAPTQYLDYLMVETADLENHSSLSVAQPTVIAPFFKQPEGDPRKQGTGSPPGFYAPEFWWQNLDLSKAARCSEGRLTVYETGGLYEEVSKSNDLWPTPPRNAHCKEGVAGELRAVCTYQSGESLDLATLVEGLGGEPKKSGIWIQAFGGEGGYGGTGQGGDGGVGGTARTYFDSAAALAAAVGSPRIYYYLGRGGEKGAGGASTVVASADISSGGERARPCITADPNGIETQGNTVEIPNTGTSEAPCPSQNIVLVAAGGGGGGRGSSSHTDGEDGSKGGHGGFAVATTRSMTASGEQGNSHKGGHHSHPGYNGTGGAAPKEGGGTKGGDRIGGLGGPAGGGGSAAWNNAGFYGGETYGGGGEDGSGKGGHGGGGGGGFGGGSGGGDGGHSSCCSYGGAGGSGGGSFALGGDAPPTENVPQLSAPNSNGALVIVVEGTGGAEGGKEGDTGATRSCVARVKGRRGRTRARVAAGNLPRGNRYAGGCRNARRLVVVAARRPRRSRFRARGFACRRTGSRSRGRTSWRCVYRHPRRPGYARVVFTLPPRR